MKEVWDQRYRTVSNDYAFGTTPNTYFASSLANYASKGKLLLPGEGEGRNAVFAAKQGWEVTAFDISSVAREKALKFAQEQTVNIDYLVGEPNMLLLPKNTFDALALIYVHFPAEAKSTYHQQLAQYLKKGGLLIFEAFSKQHLPLKQAKLAKGGPGNIAMLFSIEELRQDFHNFQFLELKEEEIDLNAGPFHQGKGAVIRFVARKTD